MLRDAPSSDIASALSTFIVFAVPSLPWSSSRPESVPQDDDRLPVAHSIFV